MLTPAQEAAEHYILIQYVYIAMAVTYILFGLRSTSKLLKLVLKCTPIALLLGLVLYSGIKTFNVLMPLSDRKVTDDVWCLAWAVLFSLLGDFYLVFDSMFLLGIASFSMTQIIYAYYFEGMELYSMLSTGLEQQQIIAGLAIAFVSLIVYVYLFPKFSRMMSVLGIGYSCLLSFMLWAAIARAQRSPNTENITAALGAFLFYMSDMVLVLMRWRLKIPAGDAVVMVTYYSAQLLIVRSFFVHSL